MILFWANDFFLIRKIEVVSDDGNNRLLGLDYLQNKNIFFFNQKTARQEIFFKNPSIKTVGFYKKYPNQIIVEVKNDRPRAVLRADQGFFFLSYAGKILFKKKENDSRLPIINYYQNFYYYQYQAGELIDYREISTCLSFLKKIETLGLKVDSVDIAGVYMVAFNLDKKKIFFSLEKNSRVQKYQLERIIKQFRIEGKEFSNLDLRFDKPIITF